MAPSSKLKPNSQLSKESKMEPSVAKKMEKKKRMMKIVATTSLPVVNRPNADRWNAARSCQFLQFILSHLKKIIFNHSEGDGRVKRNLCYIHPWLEIMNLTQPLPPFCTILFISLFFLFSFKSSLRQLSFFSLPHVVFSGESSQKKRTFCQR